MKQKCGFFENKPITGGWFFPTHLKKYAQVKLDHFPKVWGKNKKYVKPPPSIIVVPDGCYWKLHDCRNTIIGYMKNSILSQCSGFWYQFSTRGYTILYRIPEKRTSSIYLPFVNKPTRALLMTDYSTGRFPATDDRIFNQKPIDSSEQVLLI